MLILTIITGKLSKISVYHTWNTTDTSIFNICSDEYIKTNFPSQVSDKCKKKIIQDFIDYIINLNYNSKSKIMVDRLDFNELNQLVKDYLSHYGMD
jgi:hypothetical protein